MSNTTFPSSPITFVDIPEVTKFNARFEYNFFVPDESLDFTQQRFDKKNKNISKCIIFDFSPVNIVGQQSYNRKSTSNRKTLDFTTAILEHDLTSVKFIGTRFQDSQLDGKLADIVSGAIGDKIQRYNAGLTNQFNATTTEINNILQRGSTNLFDVAKLITSDGETITGDASIIVKAASNLAKLNALFIDDAQTRVRIDQQFLKIADVGVDVQMNAKFVHSLITSVVTDPVSIHVDEVASLIDTSYTIQDTARRSMNSTGIDANEYEAVIEPTFIRAINDVKSFDGIKRIVGYIIDKIEVREDNIQVPQRPIIILNSTSTHAVDVEISYGRKYIYSIRTIAEVEFTSVLDGQVVAATILISSRVGKQHIIETVEYVAPPAPADFNIKWDYALRAPRLTWSFPVNKQRDIKSWRIFKRNSINESFELINEINFDNSIIKHQHNVNKQFINFVNSPINFYIDDKFNISQECIYTVCSVDAHGLMSNYSTQFVVTFNTGKNKITTKLLSIAGAPISYPNMYIDQEDIFVDVITDSQHKQVDIFFDPDTHILTRGALQNNIIIADNIGLYRLQFINCDLQQSAAIDLTIHNNPNNSII